MSLYFADGMTGRPTSASATYAAELQHYAEKWGAYLAHVLVNNLYSANVAWCIVGANQLAVNGGEGRPTPQTNRLSQTPPFATLQPLLVTNVRMAGDETNLGGLTVVPGNRLGLQSVHYERMVPAVGVVM